MNRLFKNIFSVGTASAMIVASALFAACNNSPAPYEEGNTYTVVLDYNDDASRPRTVFVDRGSQFPQPDEPIREGYRISGWYTEEEGGTPVEFPFSPQEDTVLYAHWEAGIYNVTFDWNFENSAPYVIEAPYNSTIQSSAEADAHLPEREGYTFLSWLTGEDASSSQVIFPYTVRRDVTFYARWIENDVQIYHFTLDANYPAASGLVNDHTQIFDVIEGEQFPSDDLPNVSCGGYVFLGWALTPDAGEDDVIDFSRGFVPEESGTLYGIWQRQSYNVRFRINTPDNFDGIYSQNLGVFGGDMIQAPADPAREGFIFDGWYTASQGGTQVQFPYEVSGSANLYAHWTSEQVTTDIFDAEFTAFNPSERFPGYSGSVIGCRAIVMESNEAMNASTQAYPLYNNATHSDYYVSYMFKQGATLTFVINSSQTVTNALLIANLGAELRDDIVLSSDPNSPFSYTISVNGEAIDYGQIDLSGTNIATSGIAAIPFRECTIGRINLIQGENIITLVTTNNSAALMGGTMTAVAPTVDYIRIAEYGSAQLTWSPVYDNIYNRTR